MWEGFRAYLTRKPGAPRTIPRRPRERSTLKVWEGGPSRLTLCAHRGPRNREFKLPGVRLRDGPGEESSPGAPDPGLTPSLPGEGVAV